MFVFVSYRRGGSRHIAGRLRDRIGWEIGSRNVFMDTHSLRPGEHFPDRIRKAVRQATHTLVVIGPGWDGGPVRTPASGPAATVTPSTRIFQQSDFVVQEVELALKSAGEVIPVLVDGATMPTLDEMPSGLQPLLLLNAYTIHNDRDFSDEIRPLLWHMLGREPRGGDTVFSVALKALAGAALGFTAFLLFSAVVQFVLGLDAAGLFSFTDRESAEALWRLLPALFTTIGAVMLPVLRRRWSLRSAGGQLPG